MEFDHIGPGPRRNEEEPSSRIWLHFRSNCRITILVQANGVPDESPKNEIGLQYDVVLNRPVQGLGTGIAPSPQSAQATDRQGPEALDMQMPRGCMTDVSSLMKIMPGKEILFSIPVNHISERWHIEIPFEFDLPKEKCCRDPKVSLGPNRLIIEYSPVDLPPEELGKISR